MDLADYHHDEQKRIARWAVSELLPAWHILDFNRLKETTPAWLKIARPAVERSRLRSSVAAAEFVRRYRSAIHPEAAEMNVEIPELTRAESLKIAASLTVTGPVWMAKQSEPGMSRDDIPQIIRDGFSKSTGAVIRIVLNGGRRMVRDLVMADPLARGIAGVADEDACKSCQFLTKPIMKSAGPKRIRAVSVGHDFCTCSAKPIY